jgi:hemoglobin/transferrin/lactoferrin receptor protein
MVHIALFKPLSWLALAIIGAPAARAQTDSTLEDSLRYVSTERIVVSASRWEERASTSSRQIISLTPRDVRNLNPGTSADLLEATGEVYMQRSQAGGGSPRLRGFGANNVLMVIDGVRINNAIYRTGNLQNLIMLDAESLEEAEVLLGPGSVQYGSDALGGVMVFNTKTPSFSDSGTQIYGSGLIRGTSATAQRTVSADVSLATSSLTSSLVITASRFGDVLSGGSFPSAAPAFGLRTWYVDRINGKDSQLVNTNPLLQRQSGYDQINILKKFSLKVSDHWTLNASSLYTSTSDVPRYDRLYEQQTYRTLPRFAEWYYGPQVWFFTTTSVKGSNLGAVVEDIVATASYQWYQESRHSRLFASDVRLDQTETISLINLNVDGRTKLADGEDERDLYYGLEISLQDAASSAQNIDILTDRITRGITRYPDGGSTYNTYAAYAQLRWSLAPSLTLSGGLRATKVDLRSNLTDSSVFILPYKTIETSPSAITGSMGFVWRAMQGASMRVNLASGFRAPNIDDMGKVFESRRGALVIPNTKLGPMYVTTAEAGFDVSPLSWLTITGTYYHSWLKDLMQIARDTYYGSDLIEYGDVVSKVTSLQNVGSGWIDGVSISAQAAFNDITVDAQASVATGRDNTGAVLMHVVPAFGQARLTWRPFEGAQLIGETRWSAAWTRSMIPESEFTQGVHYTDVGLPAWTIANIRASYELSRWITAQASIENIFDLQYRSAGSGISAPGRNIMVALRCRF